MTIQIFPVRLSAHYFPLKKEMSKLDKPKQGAESQVPNCLECVHYYITWDTRFPYGCRAMDFKSKRMPQWDVLESSGKPCLMFKLRIVTRTSR